MVDQHQRPASPDERAALAIPAPTHAERCRTLVQKARWATLCTIAREPEGFPYGSLVTIAIDGAGRPLLLLSTLAEHTRNLQAESKASVLLTEPLGAHDQTLAVGRVTLLGACSLLPDDEKAAARALFLEQQPSSAMYVDFEDFGFYRLEPSSLRYVGGFGRMSWIAPEDYRAAEPDPLAAGAADILAHMNDDHADAVLAYAQKLAGVPDAIGATMTGVDRYGFELATLAPEGPRAVRLAFDAPVSTHDEVRRAMVVLSKRARATE